MANYDFIALDFETANSQIDYSVVSLGITAVKDMQIVDTFYSLVNPSTKDFSLFNINVNGITYENVKDEKTFEELWIDIKHFFENTSFIVAHNHSVEKRHLNGLINFYNLSLSLDNYRFIDTMDFATNHCVSKKLHDVAAYYEVDLMNHHNALEDSIATAKIIIKYCEKEKYTFADLLNNLPSYTNSSVRSIGYEYDGKPLHTFERKICAVIGRFAILKKRDLVCEIIESNGGKTQKATSHRVDYVIYGVLPDYHETSDDGLPLCDNPNAIILSEQEFIDFMGIRVTNKTIAKKGSPRISDIEKTETAIDSNNFFYGKTIVFTGNLSSMERRKAWQVVSDLGGIVKTSVNSFVHILVVGKQDSIYLKEDKMSNSERKANQLINEGKNIHIMYEDEFLEKIREIN